MLRYLFLAALAVAPAVEAATTSDVQVGDDVKTLIEKAGRPAVKHSVGSGQLLRSEMWVYTNGDTAFTYLVRDGKIRWMTSGNSPQG